MSIFSVVQHMSTRLKRAVFTAALFAIALAVWPLTPWRFFLVMGALLVLTGLMP